MFGLADVVRRRAEVAVRPTPTGALLVDLATGRCWQLNRLGADFLKEIETAVSLAEVCAGLGSRYDVSLDVVQRDLIRLAQQLLEAGLIERASR